MNERELFRETFSRMHASDDLLEEVLDMNEHGKKGKRFVKKSTVIGIAAAAMGTVAMAAAAHQWSRGMLNHLQGTTEQMQQLEEKEMASFPELSVTDEGVTVSVQQCIVNGAWGIVDLKVSGYDLPEGKEPNFQTADLEVKDWGGSWSISGQFDDGLLTDGYRVIGKDGQGIETEEDGSLVQYWQDENGDLEYIFWIFIDDGPKDELPSLAGKEVALNLEGLGYDSGKCEIKTVIPGIWQLDFTLPGADERITYDNLQQPVGNTGAALEKIVVSPISMEIFYHLPRSVQIETGYHEEMVTEEDGTQHMESVPFTYESFEEPPSVQGVRMKDGTVLMGLNAGPGASGYTDQTGETWVERFGTGKILDPENIAAVLFLDRDTLPANGEVDITEENCIEIPVC